ncbi:gliding motility-associated C-terminal domain-containing protein [Flavobacterium phragmitis]|uniref:Gliding motility-associated C-terminal domain-containing protein n=1 Tax=Flavobacterium phragmitis TaxID=739143 RepID=A0A1I1U215_9FLAO|nr:gliding motility-associated C-terminal domain-containing protein [Flavobacterium phragmitis]SFD62723.1 gliding motility-associated C-terminal domain-containing protein [Flavobacterium phragmitis]
MVKNYINFLQILFVFIFLLILPTKVTAQCAGTNGQLDLCTTITNPANQSISLFSLLGGSPVPGGTWTGTTSRGLDAVNGKLNAQLINSGGTYVYTYTAPTTAGCTNNTARVTITIGPYAGVPAPYATVCSDEGYFNLFTAFNGTVMAPHTNGTWYDVDGLPLTMSSIPVSDKDGIYEYTYTVPPVSGCAVPSQSVKVIITVVKAPKEGTPSDLLICAETQISQYTALDLNTRLSGQDKGGEWSGPGLATASDSIVNLEELYKQRGPGEYKYSYTVSVPNDRVCPDKTAVVKVTIEKQLDFTGAKVDVIKDICEPEIATATYAATLTQGTQAIPNGEYEVTFNVSGPNGGTESVTSSFVNGVFNFPVSSSYFRQVGKFTLTIIKIKATSSKGACANIINNLFDVLEIHAIPRLDGAALNLDPTCQNKDAQAHLTNATLLPDGNYTITYNVTGDNFALGQSQNITVSGGKSDFVIAGNLNRNSGASTIVITSITNTVTGCTNSANVRGNLIINPLPNAATVSVVVNDRCLNDPVTAVISGLGNLTDITIAYMLLGDNLASEIINLTAAGGKAEFQIPANLLLNTGSTIISLANLKNNSTGCDVSLTNVLDSFIINPIPASPTVNPQSFCKVGEATVGNLVPNGNQYKWYNSETATTPIASTVLLQSGNYYVRETSAAGCTSEPALAVVTIHDSPVPILNSDGQNFCGLNNPTIADLSNNTNIPSTVVWYDAPNGNLLSATTQLIEQGKYYGFNFPSTDCFSSEYVEVIVTLTSCDNTPNDFFVPDGFSPNGDGVNDSFVIKDIEFLYPNYTLEIYNRYGNGMYKGDKNKPAWDGMNYERSGIAGGIAPNGVYFYVLHFNKDNKPPKQGRLYLSR